MPAHGADHAIGSSLGSNGRTVAAMDWRANGLVDGLAKAAASQDRVGVGILNRVHKAALLLEHAAAQLGTATYAANGHQVSIVNEDGSTRTSTKRDTAARHTFACTREARCEAAGGDASNSFHAEATSSAGAPLAVTFAAAAEALPHTATSTGSSKRARTSGPNSLSEANARLPPWISNRARHPLRATDSMRCVKDVQSVGKTVVVFCCCMRITRDAAGPL